MERSKLFALAAVAAVLFLAGCAKEEEPPITPGPEPEPEAPSGPIHVGTFTGTYDYHESWWPGGVTWSLDTAFQASMHVTVPEGSTQERLVNFVGVPSSFWPPEEETMTLVWNELEQAYRGGSQSSMSFSGLDQDSVSFVLTQSMTSHYTTVQFHGIRQP